MAIAAVSRVLKDLLNNGLIDHDVSGTINNNVVVTALPPDHIETGAGTENSQLNLYMYMATINQSWRNHAFPSRNSKGERISNPILALDLHYLLTAYGREEMHAEILLGYGMQLLHENPVLPREAIRAALASPTQVDAGGGLPPDLEALSATGLEDQIELIKITPESLNTEELSRLWTAFGSKYRPNFSYKATVVLIESTKSTKQALPVRGRNVYVQPFKQPLIESISSQVNNAAPIVDNQKILSTYNLVINGQRLRGDSMSVRVGEEEVQQASFVSLTDTRIVLAIPNTLSAGIHGVQVVHSYLMGSPPLPHSGVSSNVEAFVLSPTIDSGTINFTSSSIDGQGRHSGTIQFDVAPEVDHDQRIIILLNEFDLNPTGDLRAYSFEVLGIALASPPGATATIQVPVTAVVPGTYLLRVQVDGAESPLGTNADNAYNSPTIQIP